MMMAFPWTFFHLRRLSSSFSFAFSAILMKKTQNEQTWLIKTRWLAFSRVFTNSSSARSLARADYLLILYFWEAATWNIGCCLQKDRGNDVVSIWRLLPTPIQPETKNGCSLWSNIVPFFGRLLCLATAGRCFLNFNDDFLLIVLPAQKIFCPLWSPQWEIKIPQLSKIIGSSVQFRLLSAGGR